MWQELLGDARLYELLYRADVDLAKQVQAGGCVHCGGPLHVSDYPRKPRGEVLPPELSERYDTRLSFCCGRRGCRLRATPPSVRFLGRRVYLAAIVVLVTALRHGSTRKRRAALGDHVSSAISQRTLDRWTEWWRETFPQTKCWGALRGLFSPAPVTNELPTSWLARVGIGQPESTRLALILENLRPVTTATCPRIAAVSMGPTGTQKM